MIFPVRCMSCNKPIAQFWEKFKARVKAGEARKDILDDFGVDRYCCRAQFMGHVDTLDEIAKFKKG